MKIIRIIILILKIIRIESKYTFLREQKKNKKKQKKEHLK